MKSNAMMILLTSVIYLLSTGVAHSQSDAPGKQTLVIYQNGYSLVQDVRNFNMTSGQNQLQLTGFPETIQFSSVIPKLSGTLHDMRFDNREPGYASMIQNLVGKSVVLEHATGRPIAGILRSYSQRAILIEQADGSQVLLQNLDGYTVTSNDIKASDDVFPRLNLTISPQRQGPQQLTLNYLINGLQWQSEYAFVLSEDEKTASISGLNLIQNNLNHHFKDVSVKLIAGQINTANRNQPMQPQMRLRGTTSMALDQLSMTMESGEAESFGDLQRYDLTGTFEILPYELRRVPSVDASGVTVNKRYRYTSSDQFMEFATGGLVRVQYEAANTERNKLGKPLPSGTVKIYKPSGGQLLLIGEDQISNLATGGMLSVTSGMAFDILVRETPQSQNRITDRIFEQSSEVYIKNVKIEDVVVEVERMVNMNQRITASNIPFEMVSANRAVFKVEVKKGMEATLTFTVRTER
jgi:hypothetical protein